MPNLIVDLCGDTIIIDLLVILGHTHPAVQKNVHEYDKKGRCCPIDIPLLIRVAEKIKSLFLSTE
ncbi:MAG TPA: hypothetical protein VKA87_01290 [Nitrososphaeraceae archaeon]|nr:hypothetical protein [Nitrososphaeraceae archaeon]